MTDSTALASLFLLVAILAVVALAAVERRAKTRLLPDGALSLSGPLGLLFITILLFGISVTSDVFAPLFLQRLHGMPPLWAGYLTALVAAGWTIASVISSGFTGARIRSAIIVGPIVMLVATIGIAFSLGRADPDGGVAGVVLPGFFLLLLGMGIGAAFQHLSTSVLASGTVADNDRVSATLGMVQLFASGIGAAIGGVVVNAAGLPLATDAAGAENAARWLYWAFAAITALAIPFAWQVTRTTPQLQLKPAE